MCDIVIEPATNRQLFLDDRAVWRTHGIQRSLHQPERCGPIIRSDRALGINGTQTFSVPQWNSERDLWEWWYWAHGPEGGSPCLYVTSEDGVHWDHPSLGIHEWRGSTENNVSHPPGGETLYHVIRDEQEENPDWRYKALFSGGPRQPAVSPDGLHWTMLEVPPIPSQDTSHFTFDETSGQYLATVKHGTRWGRSVWLSTCTEFGQFSKPELILSTDEVDWENCRKRVRKIVEDPAYLTPFIVDDEDYIAELYMMPILPYEGIYVGFPRIFNPVGAQPPPHMNFTRITQTELAVSRDLYHWDRVADRALFQPVQPWDGVNYDTNQVAVCGRPVVRGDEIWVYYNAHRLPGGLDGYQKHNGNRELFRLNIDPACANDTSAICLAKLRRDGFVSMDAEDVGWVITKPFLWSGEELYVNADARWGEIHAEIMDPEKLPEHPCGSVGPDTFDAMPGFVGYRGQTVPMTGDHLRHRLGWKGNAKPPTDRPVQIRFIMRQARLYSFWLE